MGILLCASWKKYLQKKLETSKYTYFWTGISVVVLFLRKKFSFTYLPISVSCNDNFVGGPGEMFGPVIFHQDWVFPKISQGFMLPLSFEMAPLSMQTTFRIQVAWHPLQYPTKVLTSLKINMLPLQLWISLFCVHSDHPRETDLCKARARQFFQKKPCRWSISPRSAMTQSVFEKNHRWLQASSIFESQNPILKKKKRLWELQNSVWDSWIVS